MIAIKFVAEEDIALEQLQNKGSQSHFTLTGKMEMIVPCQMMMTNMHI